MKLIDKDALVAEIKELIRANELYLSENNTDSIRFQKVGAYSVLNELLHFLNTLEVKEADIWHLQEKEDIYDAVKDWESQTFACVMKDGTIQKFIGWCEDYEGHVNVHIDGVNNDYADDVDDIVKWIMIKDM